MVISGSYQLHYTKTSSQREHAVNIEMHQNSEYFLITENHPKKFSMLCADTAILRGAKVSLALPSVVYIYGSPLK